MWFSKNLTSCKKVHLWATKNYKLKRKRKQKSKEKNVWFKFCKFKETLNCREFLKTILKRIYVRGGRFQLLVLSIIIIKFGYNARCLWLKERAL